MAMALRALCGGAPFGPAGLPAAAAVTAAAAGRLPPPLSPLSNCFGGSSFSTVKEGEPHDSAGSLAFDMAVQPPQANQHLPDPAAPDAPISLVQRISEAAQDVLRPAATTGRAYHYAEDSARAVVQEQMASNKDVPGIDTTYVPSGDDAVGDMITAPRNWQFSNQGVLLDEKRQRTVAAQSKPQQGGEHE